MDFRDNLDEVPQEQMRDLPAAQQALTVRTMNTNMGAVQVAVHRHLPAVVQAIRQSAALFGDRWEYELPFSKKDGTNQNVTGPTVKCALEIARLYGNCSVEIDHVDETGDAWTFHAVFLDVETGFRLGRPFRQRKAMKTGGMKGDVARVTDNIFLVGASKALRNVVVNSLSGLIEEALEAAREALARTIGRDIEKYRGRVSERLAELGVDEERVAGVIGRKLAQADAKRIAVLVRALQGVADGMQTVDEAFPQREAEQPASQVRPTQEAPQEPKEAHAPRARRQAPPPPAKPRSTPPGAAPADRGETPLRLVTLEGEVLATPGPDGFMAEFQYRADALPDHEALDRLVKLNHGALKLIADNDNPLAASAGAFLDVHLHPAPKVEMRQGVSRGRPRMSDEEKVAAAERRAREKAEAEDKAQATDASSGDTGEDEYPDDLLGDGE